MASGIVTMRFILDSHAFILRIAYGHQLNGRKLVKAKVAERGQVTIPKPLRDRLGIRPGTVLEFREEAGHLVAEKTQPQNPLDEAYGSLGQGRRTDEILRELRGES